MACLNAVAVCSFAEMRLLLDVVEARLQVGIEYKFRFESNAIEDGSDGIMTGSSWSESVAIAFKACLPFRFKGEFC